MVTLLTPPPFELLEFEPELDDPESDEDDPVVCELVVVSEPELVVVVVAGVELDATVLPDELLAASAGSWPDTSTIEISSHAATNSATDPVTIRRRIMRARSSRAVLIAWPRARASGAFLSVMVKYLVVGSSESVKLG